jgi:hypothetical protein
MTTTFDPQLAPALLADPAHRCAAILSTATTMAAVVFDQKGYDEFRAHLKDCAAEDSARAMALLQQLARLSADVTQFTKDCRARVLGDQ